ncbi:hypothetical protein C5167_030308 [Papaver somniferum]|uniref:F-box protein At5g07610-like n=1 Tax=Papaver somniferum TaxID=3469 RepID=UPI000E70144A|nr:F-box protein At5g07610-like [Papaver somniferum]RZC86955.1 hypothetical protein C5167_030308 [Papaver somniferum]
MASCSRKNLRISDKKSSSSANIIANNDDLLIPILLHLPVKSLIVFKCVSKGLFLLKLSYADNCGYEFINLDNNKVMTGGVPFQFLNFVNDAAGLKIDGSCNGIFCCSSFRWHGNDQIFYIYNPSTNQYKSIVKFEYKMNNPVSVRSVSLAFNPFASPHYKVVCVWEVGQNQLQIEIFDSETATWKLSGGPPFPWTL